MCHLRNTRRDQGNLGDIKGNPGISRVLTWIMGNLRGGSLPSGLFSGEEVVDGG